MTQLRVTPPPLDVITFTWPSLVDFILDYTGGSNQPGTYRTPPWRGGGDKEERFQQALRRTNLPGLAKVDGDMIFGTRDGRAVLAVSFKCGTEDANGWQERVQRDAYKATLPFVEIRQLDAEAEPEASMYTVRYIW